MCMTGWEYGARNRSSAAPPPGSADRAWLKPDYTILLTSGASAPEHLVEEVIRQLQDWFACEVEERFLVEEDVHFHLPLE